MDIKHRPIFKTKQAVKEFSKRDGVDIKYVLTTELGQSDVVFDVFYREIPHPEFRNRYFGIRPAPDAESIIICGADHVEDLDFAMIEVDGSFHYSQSHHDYVRVGEKFIDGGRVYVRSDGYHTMMKVKDGNIEHVD